MSELKKFEEKIARQTLISRIETYWIEYNNGSKSAKEAEEDQNWAIDEFLKSIEDNHEA